ncbi:MAG: hypothetical protein LBC77_04555 [Spirochaetaceae bacterium]|jgi:hypothetical protein|nr:hypothetical protein [Spirochaetaceae bacterium]
MIRPVIFGCAFALLFASCAAGPQKITPYLKSEAAAFSLFPDGALYYVYIDKKRGKELYDAFFSAQNITDGNALKIMSAAAKIYLGVYEKPFGRKSVIALLSGKAFPARRGALALSASSDWRKLDTEMGVFWHSKTEDMTLGIESKALFIAFGEAGFERARAAPPEDFEAYQSGALAGGWIPDVSFLSSYFDLPMGTPVRFIIFALRRHDFGYEAQFSLHCASASQAKLTASLLTLMRANYVPSEDARGRLAEVFFANPVSVSGREVKLVTGPISAAEAAGLMPRL